MVTDGQRVQKEQTGVSLSGQTLFHHQLSVRNPPEFKETLRVAFCYFSLPSSGANVKRNLKAKERQKFQHRASPRWRGPALTMTCTQEGESKCLLAWCSAGTCIMSHYCWCLWTPVWSQNQEEPSPHLPYWVPPPWSSTQRFVTAWGTASVTPSYLPPVSSVLADDPLSAEPKDGVARICSLGWLLVASNVTSQFVAFTPKGKERPTAHQWEMSTSPWSMDCFCHLPTREDIESRAHGVENIHGLRGLKF